MSSSKTKKKDEKSNNKKKDIKKVKKQLTSEEEQALELAELERKKEERRKFIEDNCTTLCCIYADENRTKCEKIVEERIENYSDLQRHIARLHPNSTSMFMIQYFDSTEIVNPKRFKPSAKLKIIEVLANKVTPNPRKMPIFPIKWEFYNYHGGHPRGWVDMMEVRRKKKMEEEARVKRLDKANQMLSSLGDEAYA